MTDKLKPCPFCSKGEPAPDYVLCGPEDVGHGVLKMPELWAVDCLYQHCGISGPSRKTRNGAINAWNRRAT